MAACEFAIPGVKLKSLSAVVSVTPTATAPPNLLMVARSAKYMPARFWPVLSSSISVRSAIIEWRSVGVAPKASPARKV